MTPVPRSVTDEKTVIFFASVLNCFCVKSRVKITFLLYQTKYYQILANAQQNIIRILQTKLAIIIATILIV